MAKHHSPEAFAALVEPHLGSLYRLARHLLREPQDAEDLVQETCLKAFRAFHHFRPGSDGKAWLVTILINTYRDWTRKAFRSPRAVTFEAIADFYQSAAGEQERLSSPPPNPEQATVEADLKRLVRMAIEDLPPEFRLAVLLADVEGFTYKEIADVMGCPIGTVMSRLYRGRQLLQSTLRAFVED